MVSRKIKLRGLQKKMDLSIYPELRVISQDHVVGVLVPYEIYHRYLLGVLVASDNFIPSGRERKQDLHIPPNRFQHILVPAICGEYSDILGIDVVTRNKYSVVPGIVIPIHAPLKEQVSTRFYYFSWHSLCIICQGLSVSDCLDQVGYAEPAHPQTGPGLRVLPVSLRVLPFSPGAFWVPFYSPPVDKFN